jgi:hypothetical protein
MDLMESFRTLRRHWILTTTLLLLTLAGIAGVAVKLPWSYQSVSTIVLLNSKSGSALTGGNPYLSFDPSLSQAAEVVSLEVADPHAALALKARGYPDAYQVGISSVTGGPVLQTTVTGSNKNAVEHTLYGVTNEISTKLLDLQSGIAPKNMITAQVVSMSLQASRSTSKKAKPLVVVFALGLVLTFAIPQIVDGLATRRRLRRETAAPPQTTGYPGDEPVFGRRNDAIGTRSVSFRPGIRIGSERAAGNKVDPSDQTPLTPGR